MAAHGYWLAHNEVKKRSETSWLERILESRSAMITLHGIATFFLQMSMPASSNQQIWLVTGQTKSSSEVQLMFPLPRMQSAT